MTPDQVIAICAMIAVVIRTAKAWKDAGDVD